ncbi:MAG TPA: hydantoinase/oxoprolinase family protein, partial [Candidatus Binataceae bacterium]|nr:hydantoinase/oxoprolinase family protein [Candidatus Binataceae bacterium]
AIVNQLTSDGANRIVVCFSGADYIDREKRIEHIMLKRFPTHLLGSVPLLFSHEITDDSETTRRTWSALFNAFLHPAMEQFLYAAERRMRNLKTAAPLLIFRNDGGSARIAKTIALKTFGSGPRGGMEGVKALARHYGIDELISVDVGGTTSDIGMVAGGTIRSQRHGMIEGVEVSFPLADVVSVGVGGSSVIRAADGEILVGPQSVGSMPGPACFGRGGRQATITDAFLLAGVFDPKSFFGGSLALDPAPSLKAIMDNIAKPLGLSLEDALVRMESAWAGKIADGILAYSPVSARTVLAAFGGAGPMAICKVADKIGVGEVIVPGGHVAVFSAVGIGFSDLSQEYQLQVRDRSAAALEGCLRELESRAERDMFAEKLKLADCIVTATLLCLVNGIDRVFPFASGTDLPAELDSCDEAILQLRVVRPLDRVPMVPIGGEGASPAVSDSTRRIYVDGRWEKVPVYKVDSQRIGATAEGPAIVEEPFFTGKVERGWGFAMSANCDLILSRT